MNRGIVVNDTMQTVTDARIYSVGECAAHRGIAYGLVAPLFEQAKVAANHLAMFGIGRYTGSLTSTSSRSRASTSSAPGSSWAAKAPGRSS